MDLRKVPCINIFISTQNTISPMYDVFIIFWSIYTYNWFHNLIRISNSFCDVQIRVDLSYLQIDAMLKWLYINRGSECSGLLWCNTLTSLSQPSTTCYLRTLQKLLLWETLETPTFCQFWRRTPDFATLPRKGS